MNRSRIQEKIEIRTLRTVGCGTRLFVCGLPAISALHTYPSLKRNRPFVPRFATRQHTRLYP